MPTTLNGQPSYNQPLTLNGLNAFDTGLQDALLVDGSNMMLAPANMGGHNINNLSPATTSAQAVTLGQLASGLSGYVTLDTAQNVTGAKTFTQRVDFSGATKTNLTADDIPTSATRAWLTNGSQTVTGVKSFSNSTNLNGPTVAVNAAAFTTSSGTAVTLNAGAACNNARLTAVGAPSAATDAATKGYTDTLVASLSGSITSLSGSITAETARALGVEASLSGSLQGEIARATAAEGLRVLKAGDVMSGTLTVQSSMFINGKTTEGVDGVRVHHSGGADRSGYLDTRGAKFVIRQATGGNGDTTRFIIDDIEAAHLQPLNMNNHRITTLGAGVSSTDAATVGQVNAGVSGCLPLTGGTITGALGVTGDVTLSGVTYINNYMFRSRWWPGEVMTTAVYNQTTDGTGVASIGPNNNGTGTAVVWKQLGFLSAGNVSNSIIVIEWWLPYHFTGNGQDKLLAYITDFTSGANADQLTLGQFWDGNGGGGTRGGVLFPAMPSYTPTTSTGTALRSLRFYVDNPNANDTLYMCKTVAAGGGVVDNDQWTIRITQYAK